MNLEKPNMIQPALIGGVFLGVTSALPVIEWFNCACCILLIGGGVLASFILLRDYPTGIPRASYGDGAFLGILTGLIGGLVWTLVEVPLAYFQLRFGITRNDLAEIEEVLGDPNIPPFVAELVTGVLGGGALSLGILIISLFAHLVLAVIFSSIGGIIGVALFQSNSPAAHQTPGAPTVPPPPNEPQETPSPQDDEVENLS